MNIENWPLMWRTLEHVIHNPDQYDQETYLDDCGTARCIAGWAAYFADWVSEADDAPLCLINPKFPEEWLDPWDAAVLSLGMLRYSGVPQRLFLANLSWENVLRAVRDLAREDGVTPTPVIIDEMLEQGVIEEWSLS